ncbi:MAG: hypothetical protein A3J28_09850 [Acidobacteria bacterium RIFCSPLOWO2_12_FULL_60_22]|nr:MAG: hypothetical protein A3J28_09850 [Acidobacteria bacterium RIFCSPLOWO2_12_FULL_60_22]
MPFSFARRDSEPQPSEGQTITRTAETEQPEPGDQRPERFNLVAVGDQRDHAKIQAANVLLVSETAIYGDEGVKLRRSYPQKFAVLFSCPAHSANRPNFVAGQGRHDLNGNTLI